jgi:hypothetical protein
MDQELYSWRSWWNWEQGVRRYHNGRCRDTLGHSLGRRWDYTAQLPNCKDFQSVRFRILKIYFIDNKFHDFHATDLSKYKFWYLPLRQTVQCKYLPPVYVDKLSNIPHYQIFRIIQYSGLSSITDYQMFRIIKCSGLSNVLDYQMLRIIKFFGLSNVPDYQTLPILTYVFTGYFLLSLL